MESLTSHPLHDAAQKGELEKVTELLKTVDSNVLDANGDTPLMIAAHWGHLDVMQKLIEKGANVNAKNKKNESVLKKVLASFVFLRKWDKQEEAIGLLVTKGAQLESALLRYVLKINNNSWVYHRCLSANLDINEGDANGDTPLMIAAHWGHLDVMQKLIEKGADVNAKNKKNESVLDKIIKGHDIWFDNKRDAINLLLEKGVPLEVSVFHWYAEQGSVKGLKDYLEKLKAADVEVPDADNNTLLMTAAKSQQLEMMRWLIERGANVNAKNKKNETVMYSAITSGAAHSNATQEIINFLLKKGALLESALLHYYIVINNEQKVRMCLDAGLDVNLCNQHREKPIFTAAQFRNFGIMKLLIEKGADKGASTLGGPTLFEQFLLENILFKDDKLKEIAIKQLLEHGIYSIAEVCEEKEFKELAKAHQESIQQYANELKKLGSVSHEKLAPSNVPRFH